MSECEICYGDGLLDVAESVQAHKAGRTTVSWCHGCQMGRVWKEVGLG